MAYYCMFHFWQELSSCASLGCDIPNFRWLQFRLLAFYALCTCYHFFWWALDLIVFHFSTWLPSWEEHLYLRSVTKVIFMGVAKKHFCAKLGSWAAFAYLQTPSSLQARIWHVCYASLLILWFSLYLTARMHDYFNFSPNFSKVHVM